MNWLTDPDAGYLLGWIAIGLSVTGGLALTIALVIWLLL